MDKPDVSPMLPPHAAAIGMQVVQTLPRRCIARVPYAPHLVGDPDTGVIHGGVITAMLDNLGGWCIRCHEDWRDGMGMATLDLRIDYMRPAVPHQDLVGDVECYRMTGNVAFVRGIAHQGDPASPVAACTGAFMLNTGGFAPQ